MKKLLSVLLILSIISSLVCVPVLAQQTDLERVRELIDMLPASYVMGSGDIIAEIKDLIEKNKGGRLKSKRGAYLRKYSARAQHNTALYQQKGKYGRSFSGRMYRTCQGG